MTNISTITTPSFIAPTQQKTDLEKIKDIFDSAKTTETCDFPNWRLTYNSKNDTIGATRTPNVRDGAEYALKPDGSVVTWSGWSGPKEILPKGSIEPSFIEELKSKITKDKPKELIANEGEYLKQLYYTYLPDVKNLPQGAKPIYAAESSQSAVNLLTAIENRMQALGVNYLA